MKPTQFYFNGKKLPYEEYDEKLTYLETHCIPHYVHQTLSNDGRFHIVEIILC